MKGGILILMPTNKLTPEIIIAAIDGFESQKTRIDLRLPNFEQCCRWSPRDYHHAGSGPAEAQGLCRRTSADGSRATKTVGSDQRNNRVAVVTRHAGTRQTETQTECRGQSEHRGSVAEETGGKEIGGEGHSGEVSDEEAGQKESCQSSRQSRSNPQA